MCTTFTNCFFNIIGCIFIAKWISGFILEECSLWLETRKFVRPSVRPSVRPYVYPPLANFYFCLVLKPFSVHKGAMGAIAELQVDAFSTNTGNVFQSHRYVRATGTIQVFVTCYIPEYYRYDSCGILQHMSTPGERSEPQASEASPSRAKRGTLRRAKRGSEIVKSIELSAAQRRFTS